MPKTSVIQMMKFIDDTSKRLITEQFGMFTSDQLASEVNTKFGVMPGSDWLSMQLSKSYSLVDGFWCLRP